MSFLQLENISKSFGGTQALRDVSVALEAGSVHAIIGENGAGKSTIIKIVMGILQPDGGSMLLEDQPVTIPTPAHAHRLGFACVHQEPMIFPHLSVLENIFIGNPTLDRLGNFAAVAMRNRVSPVFDQLGLNKRILDTPIRTLRIGHQQLVLIAQALMYDARLILFDEPTSILSNAEAKHLFDVIRYLRSTGKAVVYISHRLEELPALADEATVLTDGRVVGHRTKEELDLDELLRLMAGKTTRQFSRKEASASVVQAEPVLEVESLTHRPLFEDVSFSLSPGEILGFYGQVGAGRSEVAQALFGHLHAQEGTVRLLGRPLRISSPEQAIRSGIGYLPEDRKLQGIFGFQSISANLTSVILRKLAGPLFHVRASEAGRVVARFRDQLSIKMGSPEDAILSLSGGGQQKVVLARWMAENLSVLILDEPTRGIDVGTKQDIHQLIFNLAENGLGIIVISSDLPEILSVSTRVVVMNRGHISARFDEVDDSLAEAILAAAVGMAQGETG